MFQITNLNFDDITYTYKNLNEHDFIQYYINLQIRTTYLQVTTKYATIYSLIVSLVCSIFLTKICNSKKKN